LKNKSLITGLLRRIRTACPVAPPLGGWYGASFLCIIMENEKAKFN